MNRPPERATRSPQAPGRVDDARRLEVTSWLAGTVRRGPEPIAGVPVRVIGSGTPDATPSTDDDGVIVAEVVTDATGQFGVAVPEGRWLVAVVAGADSASAAVRTRARRSHHVVLRITASGTGVDVVRIPTPPLGNITHVLHRDGVAVVVDAPRDIDRVERVLDELGLELHGVLETHLHNDYLTGGRALARRHRATYVVPSVAGLGFEAMHVRDGDVALLGPLRIAVIGTPGHTDEHTAFHVTDAQRRAPGVLLTGGSLLNGFVGRPGFDPEQLTRRARQQYWSVRRLGRLVPGSALVLPTHGGSSFCSAPASAQAVPGVATRTSGATSTVAEEMQTNPTFAMDEESFLRVLQETASPPPRYFRHLARLNAAGPTKADLTPPLQAGPRETARRAQSGEWLVDVRPLDAFAAGHVPGALTAFPDDRFAVAVGSVLPFGAPLTLIGAPAEVAAAQRQLALIGTDRPAVFAGALDDLLRITGRAVLSRGTFLDLVDAVSSAPLPSLRPLVLDVRGDVEWRAGHLRGAVHRTLGQVESFADGRAAVRAADLGPGSVPVWVHCASGYRAAVAASLLARRGVPVVHVDDEVEHAQLLAQEADASWWCDGTDCDDQSCTAR